MATGGAVLGGLVGGALDRRDGRGGLRLRKGISGMRKEKAVSPIIYALSSQPPRNS